MKRSLTIWRILSILLCFLFYMISLSPTKAADLEFTFTDIANNAGSVLDIYHDKIAYSCWRENQDSVCLYDLSTESETIISHKQISEIQVGDNQVVYTYSNWDANKFELYVYDINSQQEEMIDSGQNLSGIDIYGDNLVYANYTDEVTGDDIYIYNLTQKHLNVLNIADDQFSPAIYGSSVVYEDYRNGNGEIYVYNIETQNEKRLTTQAGNQTYPRIYGNNVIYRSGQNNRDLIYYNLSTEETFEIPITTNHLGGARIYGDIVAYYDSTAADVFIYDLAGEKEYTLEANAIAYWPEIYGDNIVWQHNWGVRMATIIYPGENGPTLVSHGEEGPTFSNLPGTNQPINISEGQVITTNPYVIQVRPLDDSGIEKVEFYVDDQLICTDTQADGNGVYDCSWNTSLYHTRIKIIAYNTLGNTTTLSKNAVVYPILPETGARLK